MTEHPHPDRSLAHRPEPLPRGWFGVGPDDGTPVVGSTQHWTVADDGTQSWTTTWTFTVTRTPGPVPGPVAQPVAQPAVPYPQASYPQPPYPTAPTTVVRTVRTGPPARTARTARTARNERTARARVPLLLPVALCVALGLGAVTAGIRSHSLERFGLRATDNDTVVTEVLELFGLPEQD